MWEHTMQFNPAWALLTFAYINSHPEIKFRVSFSNNIIFAFFWRLANIEWTPLGGDVLKLSWKFPSIHEE